MQRGQADRPGPDIVDPLLSAESAAVERGRIEIDQTEPASNVQIECRLQVSAQLGQLVRVIDATLGATWAGKIVGIRHTPIAGGAVSLLTIERPQ